MSNQPTIRQQKFVKAFLEGKTIEAAAIEAGYSPKGARTKGSELLRNNRHVMRLVEEARKELRDSTKYGAEAAMAELNEGIAFARKTENAAALARFVELKMKMTGHLDKDRDAGGSAFQINIVGVDYKAPAPVQIED